MAFPVIVPAAKGVVTSAAAQREAEAFGYAAFRAIVDDYEEAPRPSRDDVESVAHVLREACTPTIGQNTPERVTAHGTANPVFRSGYVREDVDLFGTATGPFIATRAGTHWTHGLGAATAEGRSYRLKVAPGLMGRRSVDLNARDRTLEAQADRDSRYADVLATMDPADVEALEDAPARGEIMLWSAKSRVGLTLTVPALDFSDWTREDGTLAMVTLTLPGNWQVIAPTGKQFKKKLRAFEMRWRRAGLDWRVLWKLEFQKRGAPHWHGLMRIPVLVKGEEFPKWLSRTWADVCGASDEIDGLDKEGNDSSEYRRHLVAGTGVDLSGKDFSDPRRIAMYFLGHSAKTTDGKEYQHIVPELWQAPGSGPGRFWGYAGFKKAIVEVEVNTEDYATVGRVLRKVRRAAAWKTAVRRANGRAMEDHKPFSGVRGDGGKYRGAFEVETPKPKKRLGRAARRTLARKRAEAVQLVPLPPIPVTVRVEESGRVIRKMLPVHGPQNRVDAPLPRLSSHRPMGLGNEGGYSGGSVVVNDALQLALDVSRFLDSRVFPGHEDVAASWLGHLEPSSLDNFDKVDRFARTPDQLRRALV